jgi:biotin carboxylase
MSRILILGGGSSQLSAIRRCRKMGHHVVVADISPDCPGRLEGDAFADVSTFDPDGVSLAAAEHQVHGILTIGSDQPVLTQAVAAERLDLPAFLDPRQALLATNKKAMKLCLAGREVPLAPFAFLKATERSIPGHVGLPAVIKPLDSQGQRGIFYLTEREIPRELMRETLSFSREKEVIVEEFYPGGEVTVSGWMRRGHFEIYSITDRVTRHELPRLGVCFAHRYPSRHAAAAEEEIRTVSARAVQALGIEEGPVYIQLLVGDAGVRINEIACRLGGAYEDEFIPRIAGVDMLDLLIRGTLGEELDLEDVTPEFRRDRFFSIPLLFCRPGLLDRWEGVEEAAALPGVRNLDTLLPPGTEIRAMHNSTQRAAYGIIEGSSPHEVNTAVEELFRSLKALDRRGAELLIDSREECRFPPGFQPPRSLP